MHADDQFVDQGNIYRQKKCPKVSNLSWGSVSFTLSETRSLLSWLAGGDTGIGC